MNDAIAGDLGVPVAVDTRALPWRPSPSPDVERKRLHRVGPAESGQVTSLVRYAAGSRFPAHDHPEGEEILVLSGVFSDEHGDWPAGTYLLNPEGFRHAPFSREGCTLFVKLRQLAGRDRRHVAIATGALAWQPTGHDGVADKPLYEQNGYTDRTSLLRLDAGAALPACEYPLGAEWFVLSGSFHDETGEHAEGAWLRLPAGARHALRSGPGCTLYRKLAGLPYLRSGNEEDA
ncbi:MAG: anti-sigma factor [Myxococcales bacterium]|nr:anti-sigma factor [Myxococcales bacterium]